MNKHPNHSLIYLYEISARNNKILNTTNNTTFSTSIIRATFNDLDINGTDYDPWWSTADGLVTAGNEIYLQVTQVGSNNIIGLYGVKNITDNTTYWSITVAFIAGSGSLTNAVNYTISWVYNGAAGASGFGISIDSQVFAILFKHAIDQHISVWMGIY